LRRRHDAAEEETREALKCREKILKFSRVSLQHLSPEPVLNGEIKVGKAKGKWKITLISLMTRKF